MSRKPKVGHLVNFKKAKLPTKQKLVGNFAFLKLTKYPIFVFFDIIQLH